MPVTGNLSIPAKNRDLVTINTYQAKASLAADARHSSSSEEYDIAKFMPVGTGVGMLLVKCCVYILVSI
jgi:hypothetical protein